MSNRPPHNRPKPGLSPFNKPIFPVFVSKMAPQHGGEPDGFALIAAPDAGTAGFQLERLLARDFPRLIGSSWTTPEHISGIYRLGTQGVVFMAMPKSAPFQIRGE